MFPLYPGSSDTFHKKLYKKTKCSCERLPLFPSIIDTLHKTYCCERCRYRLAPVIKTIFINVSYHILVASLALMALF